MPSAQTTERRDANAGEAVRYTRALGAFAAALSFEDLPPEVRHQGVRAILDTIGCGLFGSRLPWCRAVLAMVGGWGGSGPVPVWGTDARVAPDAAALTNGTQVHSFEMDDLHKEAIIHPGGVTVPALFAVVDSSERAISGRQFLTAAIAGYEVSIRVGMATGVGLLHRGWHNNGVLGTFGGAAGAGRLLELSEDAMTDAIGMAASQSAGLMSAQFSSMIKRIHAGKAAQSGLYAAALADEGIRGIRDVFETDYGGFPATFADAYELDELTVGLGEQWRTEAIGFKPYAACGSSHTGIDAALDMRRADGVRAEDIVTITIESSTATAKHVGWPYAPDTVTTAQMNLPFAVASAFLFGSVSVDAFADERLTDPHVIELAGRVRVVGDEAIDAKGRTYRHEIRMRVELADGRVIDRAVPHARGSEHHPLSDEELDAKFTELAEHALAPDQAERLRGALRDIEAVQDMREISALLVAGAGR